MHARGPRAVAEPPRRGDRLPDRPPSAPDDNDLRQRPGVLLRFGVEGAQSGDESIQVAAPVRMVRPDEVPAAAPALSSLSFVHQRNRGHLLRDRQERE
jgi:hypothetical protein